MSGTETAGGAPPPGRPFLTAAWRHLVIANFVIDPNRLAPRVPAGTELDLFEGRALVSLVGFRFVDTRVLGISIPGHRHFDEVNLRFYVRRRSPDGMWRRAVVFVKELVPRPAIAMIARIAYNEPYEAVPMRHAVVSGPAPEHRLSSIDYEWRIGGRWHAIGADVGSSSIVGGAPALPPDGSEAAFTIEHYWGYTRQRDGSTKEYHVRHVPWRVWPVRSFRLDVDAGLVYGNEWTDVLAATPTAVVVAEGSPVAVYSGVRLEAHAD